MQKFIVIRNHRPSVPDGLSGTAGERLAYKRRPTKFEGWLWCQDARGHESWVPEEWLRIEGQEAILLQDYAARELTVDIGELVTAELVKNEWALCITESGVQGWLPYLCLQELE